MLLASHPAVCSAGELKATKLEPVDRYRCSCGHLIITCPFWLGIRAAMADRGFDFDIARAETDLRAGVPPLVRRALRPLHRGPWLEAVRDAALSSWPGWRRHLTRNQAVNAALAACLCERTGADVIIDSSKIGLRLKYLLRNPALSVRVVRLIRDGRAAVLTYVDPERFADAREPARRGGGSGGSREHERLTMIAAAREWRRSNEEAEAIVSSLPAAQSLAVRYEELAADPRSTLERIFGFIGVRGEAAIGRFKSLEHHVVGNGMRFDSSSEIVLDERWRTTLTAADLGIFDHEAGPLNRRLGYR